MSMLWCTMLGCQPVPLLLGAEGEVQGAFCGEEDLQADRPQLENALHDRDDLHKHQILMTVGRLLIQTPCFLPLRLPGEAPPGMMCPQRYEATTNYDSTPAMRQLVLDAKTLLRGGQPQVRNTSITTQPQCSQISCINANASAGTSDSSSAEKEKMDGFPSFLPQN